MNIEQILIKDFDLKEFQVQNTIKLIDEGNTIPFIARYRKEMTGSMSDTVLRDFNERLKYLRNLEERKESVINLIDEQGKLTQELKISIDNAITLQEVEDIYAPFKQKKRTRASAAKEKGLEPLANILLEGNEDVHNFANDYINEELEVLTKEDAIQGAMDIVCEIISEDFDLKKDLREMIFNDSSIITELKNEDEEEEKKNIYKMYFDFSEDTKTIASYRILAINRAENENILKVTIDFDFDKFVEKISKKYIKTKIHEEIMIDTITDSLKRLIIPSLEREIRNSLTERADEKAIEVFGKNLASLLMQSPLKNKVVMGWDPAYRTGCKIAVIDKTGKVIDHTTVYPTAPQNDVAGTTKTIKELIKKHNVSVISIGNGTASRESEQIVADIIKDMPDVYYTIVNEAGASVYSASKLGEEELPDLNVSIRGAVSIARRLQDPMSELVKIEPKSIGVGQYQHDINQKRLSEVLSNVVEDNVNSVGIDLNTASYSILSYISGISASIAKNIIKYRDENGFFKSRKDILKVPRLGPKAYTQCAGFLRIKNEDNILDNTAVHPESYEETGKLLELLDIEITWDENFAKNFNDKISTFNINDLAQKLNLGVPTLTDIITELKKPGLDPRDEQGLKPVLRSDVLKLEDLNEGMILKGTVRNVLEFGAFVDIGIKNDGLVHISEISHKFVKNPSDFLSVGDIVDVKVIGIDTNRGKVSLSMKM